MNAADMQDAWFGILIISGILIIYIVLFTGSDPGGPGSGEKD